MYLIFYTLHTFVRDLHERREKRVPISFLISIQMSSLKQQLHNAIIYVKKYRENQSCKNQKIDVLFVRPAWGRPPHHQVLDDSHLKRRQIRNQISNKQNAKPYRSRRTEKRAKPRWNYVRKHNNRHVQIYFNGSVSRYPFDEPSSFGEQTIQKPQTSWTGINIEFVLYSRARGR